MRRREKTPALVLRRPRGPRESRGELPNRRSYRVRIRSAEAVSDVVKTSGPSVLPRGALDSMGCPRSESCERSWERARCGCTQVVRVADVGWMYRASSTPGGRKTSWCERALARKKLESPPDAGHERTDGETVRGLTNPKQVPREIDLRVSACRFSIRRKAFSDHRLFDLYGKGSTESSGS